MSKQILILNGSPRIHGNTAALIDAFTAGAEAAGHTITRFDLAALDTVSYTQLRRSGIIFDLQGKAPL